MAIIIPSDGSVSSSWRIFLDDDEIWSATVDCQKKIGRNSTSGNGRTVCPTDFFIACKQMTKGQLRRRRSFGNQTVAQLAKEDKDGHTIFVVNGTAAKQLIIHALGHEGLHIVGLDYIEMAHEQHGCALRFLSRQKAACF